MISSFDVRHFKYLPFSHIVVNISPAGTVLFNALLRNDSRTSTRKFGFLERSRTFSMQRVDRPSSLSNSK